MLILTFTRTFKKQFSKFSTLEKKRILLRLEQLGQQQDNLDIKKMKPKSKKFYRFRFGNFRIIFKHTNKMTIKCYEICLRGNIY